MKKQFIHWIFFCLALVSAGVVAAQSKDFTLKIDGYRGEVQWEQSFDHKVWETVNGGNTELFIAHPTKTTYYRARITEPGCQPVFSGIKAAVSFNDTMYAGRLIKGKVEIPAGSVVLPADVVVASVLDTTLIAVNGSFELLVPDSADEFTLVASTKAAKLLMLGHFVGHKEQYVINTEESALAILTLFPGLKPVAASEKPAYSQLYKKEAEFQQLISQVLALQMQGKPLFENISTEMRATVHTLVKKSFNSTRMRIGSTQLLQPITISSYQTSSVKVSNLASFSYTGQFYNQDGGKVGPQFNLAGKQVSGSKFAQLIINYLGDPNRNTTKTELTFDLKNEFNLPNGQYELRLRSGLAFDGSAENATAIRQNFVELVILQLSSMIKFDGIFNNECFKKLFNAELGLLNPSAMAEAAKENKIFTKYVFPFLRNIEDFFVRGYYNECYPDASWKPNRFIRGVLEVANFLDDYGESTYYVGEWVLSESKIDGCQYLDKNFETSDCFQLLPATTLKDEYEPGDTVQLNVLSKTIKAYYPFKDEEFPFAYFDWSAKDGYFIPGNKTSAEGRTLLNGRDSIKWVLPCDFVMADANATIPGVKSTAALDMFFTKVYVPELKLVPSGNKQEESVAKPLPANLSIQLIDTFRNVAFSPDNYTVTWAILSGKGKIEPIAPNNTSAKWTLGTEEGEQQVKVTVKTKNCDLPISNNSFVFSATALGANSLQIYSGNKQVAKPTAYLKDPVKVLWRKADGTRISNGRIDWVIESGNGSLDNAISYTDNDGIAINSWRLGTTGIQKVKVTAKKDDGTDADGSPLYFTAIFDEPYILYMTEGDNQEGLPNTELNKAIEVQVNNANGDPLPGVLVNWSITKGNGQLKTMLGITNSEGRCSNTWTLGASGEQQVKASVKNSSNQEILFSPTSFTAKFKIPGTPTVTTRAGCASKTTMTLIGDVTSQGVSYVNPKGFCWSTFPAPTIADNKTENGYDIGLFYEKITGLTPNTVYYARAYATNSAGVSYGNEVRITTIDAPVANLPSVTIGTQTWSTKNLNVVTYCNGDPIPQVTDPVQWRNLNTGAWCHYNNDPANDAIYGKLYNWYALNDPRGIAPPGWHVPSDAEWDILVNYLGGSDIAGNAMKTTYGWDRNDGSTNSSGFSALPGGMRDGNSGPFNNVGVRGWWWSSTPASPYSADAWPRGLIYLRGEVARPSGAYKKNGYSIRFIKD